MRSHLIKDDADALRRVVVVVDGGVVARARRARPRRRGRRRRPRAQPAAELLHVDAARLGRPQADQRADARLVEALGPRVAVRR